MALRCHVVRALAFFAALATGLPAAAQTTEITVAVYGPRGAVFGGIAEDLGASPELADAGVAVQVVWGTGLGLAWEIALSERIADFAIVPLDRALGRDYRIDGYADYLVQPFRTAEAPDVAAILATDYRDFVLSELGHRDFFGMGFVGFGTSSFASTEPILALEDFDGQRVRPLLPRDIVVAELGAREATVAAGEAVLALQRGSADAIEIPSPEVFASGLISEVARSVMTDYRPQLAAVMVHSDVWADFTEAERLGIEAAFRTVEENSFGRAAEAARATLAGFVERTGATVLSFRDLMTEERAAALEAAWSAGYPGSAGRVREVYDAALVEEALPEPDDRGDLPDRLPRLFFATDREGFGTGDVTTAFGIQQERARRYSCGEIGWSPDPGRRAGEAHKAGMRFLGEPGENAACAARLADALAASGGRALVYVHGYRNTFADAVGRAISLIEDVGFDHPLILWSWPSHGSWRGLLGNYPADETHNEDSRRRFDEFLEALTQSGSVERLDMITHSMGGRIGVHALYWFGRERPGLLGHAVFVAPDVSNNGFRDAVSHAGTPSTFTLYASEHDKPLVLSDRYHDQPRAGQGGPHLIVMNAERLDTVDAGPIDNEAVGGNHLHAVELPEGLRDLAALLASDLAPCAATDMSCERPLTPERVSAGPYWVLERDNALRQALRRN